MSPRLAGCVALLLCLGIPPTGLSGADAPASRPRSPAAEPTAEERREELAARSAQLEADIARLRERLARLDADRLAAVRERLGVICQRYEAAKKDGRTLPLAERGTPETGVILSGRGLNLPLKGGNSQRAFDALVSTHRFLQGRGTDLVVVPVPTHSMVYSYRLVPDTPPDAELFPRYSELLIALAEAGVEVVDLRDALRAHEGKETVKFHHDHHWSSTGARIGMREVALRLQRYGFVAAAAAGREHFTVEAVAGPQWGYPRFKPDDRRFAGDPAARTRAEEDLALVQRLGIPPRRSEWQVAYDGPDRERWDLIRLCGFQPLDKGKGGYNEDARIYTPVTILGDSYGAILSNHHRGPADLLSAELGTVVCHVSKAHSSGFNMFGEYLRMLPVIREEPRVIVAIFEATALFGKIDPIPADHRVVKLEALDELPAVTAVVELTGITPIPPDLARQDYQDANRTLEAVVKQGVLRGRRIVIVQPVMQGRKLLPGPVDRGGKPVAVKAKAHFRVDLVGWGKATRDRAGLGQVMLLDEVEDQMLPRYLVTKMAPTHWRGP